MVSYLFLVLGVAAAGAGGELFVRGSVGLAHWARIAPGIVGATVAAFATSSPELSVGIGSAVAGKPEISFGDVLGSNVVNVALILGITLSLGRIRNPRGSVKRDFPVALLVPVVTGVLSVDGSVSRIDGALLLALFFVWLGATVVEVRRQRSAAEAVLGEPRLTFALAASAAGLVLLFAAGRLIVRGATGIATAYGIDAFTVGATIVAAGTSVPELATAVVSKLRGHDEVGLGTVLGSNIFNGLWIVGLVAAIQPITVQWREAWIALVFGAVTMALTYPSRDGFIDRRRGILLLVLYVVYLVAISENSAP